MRKAHLYTNNHFSAQSVINATMIKEQLGEPVRKALPDRLVEHYPNMVSAAPAPVKPRTLLEVMSVQNDQKEKR